MNISLTEIARYPAHLRLGIFIAILGLLWLPFLIFFHFVLEHDPNTESIFTMGSLFIIFLFWVNKWGKEVHNTSNIFKIYGFQFNSTIGIELLKGLGIGGALTFILFIIQVLLGWATFTPNPHILRFILEGALTGIGVACAEELLFRGWLYDELARDYSSVKVLWINALAFASLHFIKPWGEIIRTFPQFPGLILLALALVLGKRLTQLRLGLSIGLHGGLVWAYYIINVGQLIKNNKIVFDWITGVDNNPLSGFLGLGFLTILVLILSHLSEKKTASIPNQ